MNVSFTQILNTQEKKLAFFQNIVLVAIADRYVDKLESDFLVSVGDQLQLTEKDTLHIADNLKNLKFIIPQDGLQKSLELEMLVKMVLQDGIVEKREYDLCLEYTRQIGFTKEKLDELIAQSKN
ncbi:hypothetical protein I5M27_07335 [Adhaeribacter sp. BT258]|uniref:Co-chaperone DjlA N-terminal domain-containing protein n=1 Tax=Adhaeribacter terrigena TaxID=2793070 RepID=A0ABS1C0C5_9BACT|nr:hypothetical protein [Adhaeribacter terrigena]MBK0402794.1 hypothetical protein [Adhaeribacter terrigena]